MILKKHLGLLAVLLAALIVYLPSLYYHFTGDDYIFLEKVSTGFKLPCIFQPLTEHGYFRPLIWAPYLTGNALVGLPVPPDPLWQAGTFLFAYHLLNLFFHLANIIFVYLIARYVLKSYSYATFSAFIFALHPINTEVVCWPAVFGDLSVNFFALLSIILFAKFYARKKDAISFFYYSALLLCFALALLSKETALCIPFLIILAHIFLKRGQAPPSRGLTPFIYPAYFLITLLYFIVRRFFSPTTTSSWHYFIKDVTVKIYKVPYYLKDLIFTVDLTCLKKFVYNHCLFYPCLIAAIIAAALLLYFLFTKAKRHPVLIFALAWVIIALTIPILSPFAPMRRHLYLPLVGYSIFLVYLLRLIKPKYIGNIFLAFYIICEMLTSFGRNDLFRLAGNTVQIGLFELKNSLPDISPDSVIYLVGVPGTLKNTNAFWASAEDKIKFLYQNDSLAVFCLSAATFTEKGIKETEVVFLDPVNFTQTMDTSLEEYIRVMEGNGSEPIGEWVNTGYGRFKILGRDRFGNVRRVIFSLNPQTASGKKSYIVGFKDGAVRILNSYTNQPPSGSN